MKILIAGMGYIGEPLAQALHAQGHDVFGLTKGAESRARLRSNSPADVRQADLGEFATLEKAFSSGEISTFSQVIHCASSDRGGGADAYRKVYLQGLKNLHRLCPRTPLLFTSSTSVYAQTDGGWVDETSPAEPSLETGRILRETEDLVLASGGLVTRLSGIYGPGRSYLLRRYFSGTAVIEGDGQRYLNQAHRSDIVRALMHLIDMRATGIFNLTDSTPQSQGEVYRWLTEHFQGTLPPVAPPDYARKRGWTDKRVSNKRLVASGWEPRYASFQDAVVHDSELVPSIRNLVAQSLPDFQKINGAK